jgi:hemin uptake protein HemP
MSCKSGLPLLSRLRIAEGGPMAARGEVVAEEGQGPKTPAPKLDVQTLLRGGREAILLHGTEEYRLRLTSNGKLILTK